MEGRGRKDWTLERTTYLPQCERSEPLISIPSVSSGQRPCTDQPRTQVCDAQTSSFSAEGASTSEPSFVLKKSSSYAPQFDWIYAELSEKSKCVMYLEDCGERGMGGELGSLVAARVRTISRARSSEREMESAERERERTRSASRT